MHGSIKKVTEKKEEEEKMYINEPFNETQSKIDAKLVSSQTKVVLK